MGNQSILIIGGSKGIGEKLVEQLAPTFDIVTINRTPSKIKNSKEFLLDITSDELPVLEQLDHIVYCPGSINLKPISSLSEDDFKSDFEINVLGAVKVIKKYVRLLKKSPQASITLFSSVAASTGMSYHSSIAASKGAIEGLIRSLAAELSPKIRVNGIAPTITNTPLAQHLLSKTNARETISERHPLKSILEPEDIANMAAFLISDKASKITGQIMHVDAGMSNLKP